MRGTPADPSGETVDGLRVGPWVPPPYTGTRRRGRHTAAAPPDPVPVFDPDAQATRALPVDIEPEPERRGGRWLAVALVAVGLAVAVVVPLVAARHPGHPTAAPPIPAPASSDSPAGTAPDPSTTPSPTVSPSPTRSASPSPSASPSRSAAPGPVPPFPPVTIEAEDPRNTIGGSAWIDTYDGASGGRIVRNIGMWNGSPKHAGSLRITVTVPASGTYQLTVYAVHLDAAAARTLVVQVSGGAPVAVQSNADDVCCTPVRVRVALRAGDNVVTFTNPDDHAPSIDRIVLSA